ncbi:TerB N-terminal domain-containing protein [Streptosporangium lutulentum]|uniref:Tellurite resistance protein B-like protein n=1 Tax=Streptosporangium lutulentum TaxID=1461250 RepID=A0ABT9Q907_9ACTN|nr:TerB N-terminal domain-containing protein [Streptosporangium lutulentum]MDP9842569.1 putative tellurite resistance protein B-like protein [Streptosporangium lutulentum]
MSGRHASAAQAAPAAPVRPPAPAGSWLPPGEGINLAGLNVVGGLLYVGSGLPSVSGTTVEPALIDPRLPVDMRRPDWSGQGLDHWPSYAAISPRSRAAYLAWLADGRRYPQAPIGYVFLYLYGLERRALHDLTPDRSTAPHELPIIHAEVRRLLTVYGDQAAFRRYAGQFEQVLGVLATDGARFDAGAPPAPTRDSSPSLRLRAGLGAFAAQRRPIPAEWALSWIGSHPGYRPRTAATRCAREFGALFRLRYAARHGQGLVVQPGHQEIALGYRPASAGFRGGATLTLAGIPDVLTLAAPTRELMTLADECTSELEAYSRFIGRVPDGHATVQAQALLPAELADLTTGDAGRAVAWARDRLGHHETAVVAGEEFAALISAPDAGPARKDAIALARLLGTAGIGIEPDPRLGGPVPSSGPLVLFAAPGGPTAAASDAYQAATLLLHLAAAVSAADGETSAAEQRHLSDHLERALHLTSEERRRLHAHLRWLIATPVKLSGLTRRIAGSDENQRVHVAEFLIGVAAADGHISPDEVRTLTKIYRLLGLDPGLVHPALPLAAAPAPAPAPIAVQTQQGRGQAVSRPPAPRSEPPAGRLDQAMVAAKLAETARVAVLLGSIFAEEEPAPVPAPPPAADPVAGLDDRHSGLVRALATAEQVSRGQFEHLAARWSLLPDGALDRINEAAYEMAGEPLLEGDDPIRVNRHLLGEVPA